MIPKGSKATLKQRLAALTQTPSSPPSPIDTSPKSPQAGPKRKFSASWTKRITPQTGFRGEFEGEDRLQLIISKVIYQAGVDYECVNSDVIALCVSDMHVYDRTRPM
jgi:Rho GTPase-activating protein 1